MTTASAPKKKWKVRLHPDFDQEFRNFTQSQQDDLLAAAKALKEDGPGTGRPLVDTLKGSRHQNMKELRYDSEDGTQVWRAAFAFDPNQQAVVLCAADKQGVPSDAFYKALIAKADKRYSVELKRIDEGRKRSEARRKEAEMAAKKLRKGTKAVKGRRK